MSGAPLTRQAHGNRRTLVYHCQHPWAHLITRLANQWHTAQADLWGTIRTNPLPTVIHQPRWSIPHRVLRQSTLMAYHGRYEMT